MQLIDNTKLRNQKGNTIALATSLAFLAVIMIVGVSKVGLSIGGSRESQNGTEAGALNMAAQSFNKITTSPQDYDERQFADVLDTKKSVSLANINRVWGKALLANINVKGMGDTYGSSQANNHGQVMFEAAKRISDRLADELNDPNKKMPLFDEMSSHNVASMTFMHSTVKAVKGQDWKTSLVDRSVETNIELSPDQMPFGFNYKSLPTTQVDGKDRLKGYTPMTVNGKTICFVPFKNGERTQLISAETFSRNTLEKKPLPQWQKPVPNAFSTLGQAKGSPYTGVSYVLANPQRVFPLTMPAGFVRITLLKNEADCFVGPNTPKTVSYEYGQDLHWVNSTESSLDWKTLPPVFKFNDTDVFSHIWLGTEFGERCSVKKAIFNRKIYGDVLNTLLQRVREFKPDCTPVELINLLDSQRAATGDFIICLDSSAPDAKNAKLMIAPFYMVTGKNPAINVNGLSDGNLRTLHTEDMTLLTDFHTTVPLSGAIALPPNIWGPNGFNFQLEDGTIKWAPAPDMTDALVLSPSNAIQQRLFKESSTSL